MISFNLLVTALGWVGAFLSLASYFLVTIGRIKAQSYAYQFMVFFASATLAISAAVNNAWPSAITNSIYMVIGVVMIVMLARTRIFRFFAPVLRGLVAALRAVWVAPVALARTTRYVVPVRRAASARVIAGAGRGSEGGAAYGQYRLPGLPRVSRPAHRTDASGTPGLPSYWGATVTKSMSSSIRPSKAGSRSR